MDPIYETMLWHHVYVHKSKAEAGEEQQVMTAAGRRPIRRRIACWCGYAALRVGRWLLAEDLAAAIEYAPKSPQSTVVSRP